MKNVYNENDYQELTGHPPKDDDLERLNCIKTGVVGHFYCGLCLYHFKPRFICGCTTYNKETS